MLSAHRTVSDNLSKKNTYHFLVKKGTSPFTPIQRVETQLVGQKVLVNYVGEY